MQSLAVTSSKDCKSLILLFLFFISKCVFYPFIFILLYNLIKSIYITNKPDYICKRLVRIHGLYTYDHFCDGLTSPIVANLVSNTNNIKLNAENEYTSITSTGLIASEEPLVVPETNQTVNTPASLFDVDIKSTCLSRPVTRIRVEKIFITRSIHEAIRKYSKTCYIDNEMSPFEDLPLSRMDSIMNLQHDIPIDVTETSNYFYNIDNGRHRVAKAIINGDEYISAYVQEYARVKPATHTTTEKSAKYIPPHLRNKLVNGTAQADDVPTTSANAMKRDIKTNHPDTMTLINESSFITPNVTILPIEDNDNIVYSNFLKTIGDILKAFKNQVFSIPTRCTNMAATAAKAAFTSSAQFAQTGFQSLMDTLQPFIGITAVFANIIRLIDSVYDVCKSLFQTRLIISIDGISNFFSLGFYMKLTATIMNAVDLVKSISKHVGFYLIPVDPIENPADILGQAQAGSFESMGLAMVMSMLLPKQYSNIIKDMNIFTQGKVLDDTTWIYDILGFFCSLPGKLVNILVPDSVCKKFLASIFDYLDICFPYSSFGKSVNLMQTLLARFDKDTRLAGNEQFQADFDEQYVIYSKYKTTILNMKRDLPSYAINADKRITRLRDKINYTRNTTRVEPVFLVFTGPPARGKTVLMNKILTALKHNNSVYVHSSSTEKDFFDHYDNETVFVVDDVGQKGVKQWSPYINMVSTTKYPLECAAVERKDTLYFTSGLICATTNNINLTITPDCGITELAALHRRMELVDFSNVDFMNGQFYGELIFKKYNVELRVFETKRVVPLSGPAPTRIVLDHVASLMREKIEQYNNTIASEDVIYEALPQMEPIDEPVIEDQMFRKTNPGKSVASKVKELVSDSCDVMYTVIVDSYNFITQFIKDNVPSKDLMQTIALGAGLLATSSALVYVVKSIVQISYTDTVDLPMSVLGVELDRDMIGQQRMLNDWKKLEAKYPGVYCKPTYEDWYRWLAVNPYKHQPANYKGPPKKRVTEYKSDRHVKSTLREAVPQSIESLYQIKCDESHLPLQRITKQTHGIRVSYLMDDNEQIKTTFTAVFAGRYFSTPYHGMKLPVGKSAYVTVWSSPTNIIYDNILCTVVYIHERDDIAILELPPALASYAKNLHFVDNTTETHAMLITPSGQIPILEPIRAIDFRVKYKSVHTKYMNLVDPGEGVTYDFNQDALCGSFLMTRDGFLIGHHVAKLELPQDDGTYKPVGMTRIFSKETRDKITYFFGRSNKYEVTLLEEQPAGSVAAVVNNRNEFAPANNKSSIVPSLLYGIFDTLRKPAELNKYGVQTTAILDAVAHLPCKDVDINGLTFAEDYLEMIIPKFKNRILTDYETINGFDNIQPIDKTTSIGYGLTGKKTDYIDYERGVFAPLLRNKMEQIELQIEDGTFDYTTVLFTPQQKDELKDLKQDAEGNLVVKDPRIFKMAPLAFTCLFRKYFGCFLNELRLNRKLNGIQVGINPLGKDWHDLYHELLTTGNNILDGDYGKWDKFMLPQFQQLVKKIVVRACGYDGKIIPEMLLQIMCTTPTIVGSKIKITTHSFPSGLVGTAEFNSIINKAYGAYVFQQVSVSAGMTPTITDYVINVNMKVYGDDQITSVTNKYKEIYNGKTYEAVMKTIGLDFTPADKGEWNYLTRDIEKCSFLKRTFRYHPLIGQVVGPLEPTTMCGTLNYVKDDFRNDELSSIKYLNYQREAFLHSDYEERMTHINNFVKINNIKVPPALSSAYLIKLYKDDLYNELLEQH